MLVDIKGSSAWLVIFVHFYFFTFMAFMAHIIVGSFVSYCHNYLHLIIIIVDTKGSRMWVVISRWNEKIMTITTCNGCKYNGGREICAITIKFDKYDNNNLQWSQLQ